MYPICGGKRVILVHLPGGREVEAYCPECLEREAEEFEEEDEGGIFVPWEVLGLEDEEG